MKKLISIFLGLILLPSVAMAQFTVPQGGTGKTSFPVNSWIYADAGGLQRLQGSSSPTVQSITATSTTATNFFAGIVRVIGNFFLPSLSQGVLYTGSGGLVGSTATTSVTCSGSTSCTAFTVLGSAPIVISSTGGAGGAAGTWSTTTSTVDNQLINYSNNTSDIVAIGSNSTTTAEFYFDPNIPASFLSGVTTLIGGFLSQASSTIMGTFRLPLLSQGLYYGGSGGLTGSTATTSATCAGSVACSAFTVLGASPITLTGSGLTSYDAWTHPSTGISATTSEIWTTGLLSTASSTFTSAVRLSSLGVGTLNVGTGGLLYSGATTTFGSGYATTTQNALTFSTSSLSFNGFTVSQTIVPTSGALTFTPTITGTLNNTGLTNSTISGIALGANLADLTATNATLTFSGAYNGGTARTVGLNLANANNWTALQTFLNASSTLFSARQAWFGGSATTTIDTAGNVVIPSGSNLTITGKSDGCATFATGVLNSTGVACGSGGGTDPFTHPAAGQSATTSLMLFNGNASSTGFSSNYGFFGQSATTTLFANGSVGVASATPFAMLSVNPLAGVTSNRFAVGSSTATDLLINSGGQVLIGTTTTAMWNKVNPTKLSVQGTTTIAGYLGVGQPFPFATWIPNYITDFTGNVDGYAGFSFTNNHPGINNSADILLNNGSSTETSYYADFGLNSPNYSSTAYGLLGMPAATYLFNTDGPLNFATASSTLTKGYISFITASSTSFSTGSERMRITERGFVGIGTTTPFSWLNVTASTTGAGFRPQLTLTAADAGSNVKTWAFSTLGGNLYVGTTTDAGATSTTAALELRGGGKPNLSISSSTPSATLTVEGRAGDFANLMYIGSTTPAIRVSDNAKVFMPNLTASAGTPNSLCIVSTTKEVSENAALTCTVSSIIYKNLKGDLDIGLDTLRKLHPVMFEYKDNPGRLRYGFIAEQVAGVDSRFGDGYTKDNEPRSIDQNAILALVVNSIQELAGQGVNAKRSAEENWQWIVIALLAGAIAYQQVQIRRLKQ